MTLVPTEPDVAPEWDWAAARAAYDFLSDAVGDWQGIPVLLPDFGVRVHDRHPLREFFRGEDPEAEELRIVVGGPEDSDFDEEVVNSWYDASRNRDVFVFRRSNGRAFALTAPRPPDGAMDRLTYWLRTLGASDAWDEAAETKAREKLRGLVSERQWRQYDLTGAFLETSTRSRLTYVFRRLRPTVVLSPRWKWWSVRPESMRMIAVLCLHPIGFYSRSWAGCMVPSDDVIAHLLLMRGDEAYYWRKANQHDPASPEAGL